MKGKMTLVLVVTLIAVMGLAIAAYGATGEFGIVTVGGKANPKLVLTVDTDTVTFPAAEPGVTETKTAAFTVTIKSNKTYNYEATAPANFTGGSSPAIDRLDWQGGATSAGWGDVTNPTFDDKNGETKTDGRNYIYDLRLTWSYLDDPDVDYTAVLNPTAWQ